MSEYRVSIKVRNNLLLKAMEERGERPGALFAAKVPMSYGQLVDLLNMATGIHDRHGNLRSYVVRLCEYLNKMPCELFTDEQSVGLEKNRGEIETSFEEMTALIADGDPASYLELEDTRRLIREAIAQLPKDNREVIRDRFGIEGNEKTLEEIAAARGVARERVRQIEARAKSKLLQIVSRAMNEERWLC